MKQKNSAPGRSQRERGEKTREKKTITPRRSQKSFVLTVRYFGGRGHSQRVFRFLNQCTPTSILSLIRSLGTHSRISGSESSWTTFLFSCHDSTSAPRRGEVPTTGAGRRKKQVFLRGNGQGLLQVLVQFTIYCLRLRCVQLPVSLPLRRPYRRPRVVD